MRLSTTGAVVAATASVLCSVGVGVAQADETRVLRGVTGQAPAPEVEEDDEDEPSPPSIGSRHVGLIIIDNSSADSWLEVDRTLNTLFASRGTAGSDHDGGGGAIDVTVEHPPHADGNR